MRIVTLALVALMVTGCTELPETPREPGPVTPATGLRIIPFEGCPARETAERAVHATDQASWGAIWAEVCGAPAADAPGVEFDAHTVLAAFWGTQPSTGYELSFEAARMEGGELHVDVVRTAPGEDCGVGFAETHPAAFATVEGVHPVVRFDNLDRTRACPGDEAEAEAGPWRFRFLAKVEGRVGEVAMFNLTVMPNASAGQGFLSPPAWVRFRGGADEVRLGPNGTVVAVEVLAGAEERIKMLLRYERAELAPGDPERGDGYAYLQGPAVALMDLPLDGVEVTSLDRRDSSESPEGLHVRAEGRDVLATYSMGTFRDMDCSEHARARAVHAVERADAAAVVAFVSTSMSDACTGSVLGGAAHTPRVELRAGPFAPGSVAVRVFTHHTCFCPPQGGWTEHRANVTLA